MNSKILVIVAIGALVAMLGIVLASGNSTITESLKGPVDSSPEKIQQQVPIIIELDNIKILEINPRDASLEIQFKIANPNPNAVIVQVLDYQLYETNFSSTKQITGGQIGSRAGGMVEFGNNYYTLLAENSIVLKDKISLKNTGNTPELWSSLEENTAKWKVSGVVYYNLSSMTSGQENELKFEFEK